MHIYFRHSEKEYENGKGVPAHDPHLTKNGQELVFKTLNDLKLKSPDMIITSPYIRTRETASLIKNYYMSNNNNIEIYIDINLGEYLGNQYMEIEIDDITKKYGIVMDKNLNDLKKRIEDHYNYYKKFKNKNIWFITHGIFLYFLHNLDNPTQKSPKFPPFSMLKVHY